MRFFALIFTATLLASVASAQSGRQKPSPTPTPRQINGPSVVYMPTETGKPTPTATPKTNVSDDIIKVNSVLIPIPVSVLDQTGRAVATLKLADFELKIDGKLVEIGDLARRQAPIRLAILFDNSASVLIARDF